MKAKRLVFLMMVVPSGAAFAMDVESSIKARIEGIVPGGATAEVVFSSPTEFSSYEVYVNNGAGAVKVCQKVKPVPEKEYRCAFALSAPPSVNAINLYVVGMPVKVGADPEQQVLGLSNPAYRREN